MLRLGCSAQYFKVFAVLRNSRQQVRAASLPLDTSMNYDDFDGVEIVRENFERYRVDTADMLQADPTMDMKC